MGEHIRYAQLSTFQMEHTEAFRQAKPLILPLRGLQVSSCITGIGAENFAEYAADQWYMTKKERMMRCEHCGQMEFPKICPAVIIRCDGW
mgnify:CR=1 FL=1